MSIKVIIKDFEIIEDAKFIIDGLTALTGESNNGKTAIYNALKVLTYNVQGTQYVRKVKNKAVAKGCSVGLLFEDTNSSVLFEKSSSPIYTIQHNGNKAKFDKAGRGPTPNDVATILNMIPLDVDGTLINLNFLDQFAEPILIKLSEYQLYKVAVKSFDGEKIQEAIGLCKIDLDNATKELTTKENAIDVQKKNRLFLIEELKAFDKIQEIQEGFLNYDKFCKILPIVDGLMKRRTSIIEEKKKIDKELKNISRISDIYDNYVYSVKKSELLKYCIDISIKRNIVKKKSSKVLELIQKFSDKFIEVTTGLTAYKNKVLELKNIIELHNYRLNAEHEINYVSKKLLFLSGDFIKINTSLNKCLLQIERLTYIKSIVDKKKKLSEYCIVLTKDYNILSDIPNIEEVNKKTRELEEVNRCFFMRNAINERIIENKTRISELLEEIKNNDYMLENHICPLCKQKVTQE